MPYSLEKRLQNDIKKCDRKISWLKRAIAREEKQKTKLEKMLALERDQAID